MSKWDFLFDVFETKRDDYLECFQNFELLPHAPADCAGLVELKQQSVVRPLRGRKRGAGILRYDV